MKKILILDDIDVNILLLKYIIKDIFKDIEESVKIIEADGDIEFFQKYEEDIDLFFLDINMPGKRNGLDLLKHLIVTGVKKPIIMQTAYLEYNNIVMDIGATDIIHKPYDRLEIRTMLNKYLFD